MVYITAVGIPARRAEHVFWIILDVFCPNQAAFVAREPLCDLWKYPLESPKPYSGPLNKNRVVSGRLNSRWDPSQCKSEVWVGG